MIAMYLFFWRYEDTIDNYKILKVAIIAAESLFWGLCPVWIRAIMKAIACAGGV